MVDRRSVLAIVILLTVFHCALLQLQTLRLSVELVALLQLRSSLGLRSKEWPRRSDPCSNWVGVGCREGRVVSINVSGLRRTRLGRRNPQFSVNALANLTRLESFNASDFALPGVIPDWFGQQLRMLEVLDLCSCNITGAIPSSLGNLTNLRTLVLANNNLTGAIPSALGQLLGLNAIDLSGNALTGSIPVFFSSLSNLSSLDVSSNSLVGSIPPGIGILFNLGSLNLSHNRLVSSLPAELGDLARLVDLDLSSNLLSGPLPSEWRGLRSLQKLVIGDNNLVGTLPSNFFTPLYRLQIICMSHNNFSGEFPDDIWGISGLWFLDVSGNSLTGSLPNINISGGIRNGTYNLSGNLFYGRLTDVRLFNFIDLSDNFFEGVVLNGMQNNASLELNCLRNLTRQRTLEVCQSFYAGRNLSFDNFGNNTERSIPESGNSHRNLILLVGILGGSVLFVLLLVLFVLLFICFRHKVGAGHRGNGVGPVPVQGSSPTPDVGIIFSNLGEPFTYQQLLLATDEFSNSNLIKHGHSGDFFRGVLENGVTVVIKKVDILSGRKEAYLSELELFSKVSHNRIVSLIGNCLEDANQKFLIFKYMPNGDLSSSLYRKTTLDDGTLQSLDWITRLKIAIGAAEGLSYLHHECIPPLVHRDIQASSILLDDKFDVRLGSLSEVCVQEGDVHQSRITRFLRLQQRAEQGSSGSTTATCSHDVYCFGKVLLELVTGKMGLSTSPEASTKEWIDKSLGYISIYDKDLITKIIDPSLIIYEDLLEEVWAIAIVARSCLNPRPRKRPPMIYILKALENPLKVVRQENMGSARLRATSSLGSWNAALFGSWRQSSSDAAALQANPPNRGEGVSGTKQHGVAESEGSDHNDGDVSASQRRQSVDVLPGEETEREDVG